MYERGLECVCKCQCESHPRDLRGNFEGHEVPTVVAPIRTQKPEQSAVTCPPHHPVSTQVPQGHSQQTSGPEPLRPAASVCIGSVCTCHKVSGTSLPAQQLSSSFLGLFVNLPRY